MGTPEFAVASLRKLYDAGCNVVAVVTAPDKPAGRGMQLQQSAVKQYATEKGLTVLQPEKLKDPVFVDTLKSLHADLQIVVAFRMLPEVVWDMPPMGTLNLHGSLLPQYRGAAPINWAIINGEKNTGVTTFKLKHEIDTGDILLSEIIPIGDDENAGSLHDRMKEIGAEVLLKTLIGLSEGSIQEKPQEERMVSHAPKIFSATCEINWNHPSHEIYNLIRGLSPYPAAYTKLNEKKLKVFSGKIEISNHRIEPGTIETDHKTFLRFSTSDGYIYITELQQEGKKKLFIDDFLRGFR
ncbi:MAG: methionyl-tRNA formyltransferase [Ferruginibacter sp.]|nr:methionyl-tRNA formyltransferase [Ferruginibacter sp.]